MNTLLLIIFRLLIVLSVVIFFVGLFKPEWLRFRQKQPDLLIIIAAAMGLFIIGFTGAAEFHNMGASTPTDSRGTFLSKAKYEINATTGRCDPVTKPGNIGKTDDEKTEAGIKYNVRTPLNYDAAIAHPLLMVYAPARRDRNESEEFVHLTQEATAAGFIVTYADHRNMTPEAIIELAEIPVQIQNKWCIDETRIFLTGHSDGGTMAMGIAFINGTKHIPSAIAPSAVGIRGEDLQERVCPKPLPVMVMHSSHDTLFPNYGKETVEWWAKCNGCDTQSTSPVKEAEECVAYTGCKNNVKTWYCEGTATHPEWPEKNKTIIDFFKAVKK
ncbi:MAG: alpha/beta hydrolase family esterase [Methylobacter sp.]